jgi:small subunit ribosomal protein S9
MVAFKKDNITGELLGTGRRKSSVARVRIKPGTGKIVVNGKDFLAYFVNEAEQQAVLQTLNHVGQRDLVDVTVNVSGGGTIGQAGAVRMGLARALCGMSEEHFAPLRADGFLTRDSRMKERKKYGLRGARRGVQFSKR